jgi:hypothetical protein
MRGRSVRCAIVATWLAIVPASGWAQDPQEPQAPTHDMSQMHMTDSAWTFMQDGVFSGVFNHQGGTRGGSEVKGLTWWMGMLSRSFDAGQFTLNGMFSAEPATVGRDGYRELFQVGEAIDGRPNVDHQHPHDAFMQLSAQWRGSLSETTRFTVAVAPAGEPALGPVAFMHRASAAAILFAPLSHHTFDSTHISFGVVTGGVTHGRWTAEGSVFNGREPDEHRWDLDLGRLDSVSGRLWFRPTEEWAIQLSSGRLAAPEELERGNVIRTTASASWTRIAAESMSAFTAGYGRNDQAGQQAAFAEATRQRGLTTISGRLEVVQIAHDLLVDATTPSTTDENADHLNIVSALSVGGLRRVGRWAGLEGGVGANVTAYVVPATLRSTYGSHPLSVQLFFQVRPRFGGMAPMWNMRMGG